MNCLFPIYTVTGHYFMSTTLDTTHAWISYETWAPGPLYGQHDNRPHWCIQCCGVIMYIHKLFVYIQMQLRILKITYMHVHCSCFVLSNKYISCLLPFPPPPTPEPEVSCTELHNLLFPFTGYIKWRPEGQCCFLSAFIAGGEGTKEYPPSWGVNTDMSSLIHRWWGSASSSVVSWLDLR